MQCRHVINSPGSSSLLVMSCSDVTSCSCGAWITNKMLPRRHSRQPSFPNMFNTSPNRWEDRTALKHKHTHTETEILLFVLKLCVLAEESFCCFSYIKPNYGYLMRTLRAPSGVTSVAGANM